MIIFYIFQLKVPKKNPLEADRPIVVYACCDGDGFCATECDEDVGAVFSAGASVDTIKQAVAAVAGTKRIGVREHKQLLTQAILTPNISTYNRRNFGDRCVIPKAHRSF
jgi:hypothetical protein